MATQTVTLPTAGELEAAERRLADALLDCAVEGSIENVAGRVFEAINVTEEGETVEVTYEHIGTLALFARDLRNHAPHLLELSAEGGGGGARRPGGDAD